MSAPTAPPPAIGYTVDVKCDHCQTQLHHSLSSSEQQFKENCVRAITAAELHDCRSAPKGGKA